ncbi:MAG: septum formation initiator family protein [Bacteroidetes bacterium]|nr:septum formation initiator family protein [Bacteroidota bacterium]
MKKAKKIISNKKNRFFILGIILYFIWMIFFDSEDLISLYKLVIRNKKLESQKEYYIENIEKLKQYKKALLSDKKILEKIARENYYMKKEKEDIYLIK